jgi:hypothetical protein
MARTRSEEPESHEPCPECGGTLGYNETTGINLKTGHYSGCSQWKESA